MAKKITSPSDLAVNGAPPAFAEPLHVGRPNVAEPSGFMRRVERILSSKWLTNDGPMVREFEERICQRLGVKHCVAMCNGTIALEIAIRALGLSGEVIVPSWTFIATAHALHWQDITPVFADIDEKTHNLDPNAVRRMISAKTTGIIGVHVWGRAAPVEELQALADQHDLLLMFDAAHAFDSTYRSKPIGGFGKCEVFSFHATKAFNSMEGGAITTNDDEFAQTIRLMRNFGFHGYDNVIYPGTNGKMVEVCAAMGLSNLDVLDTFIDQNRRNYACYRDQLRDIEGISLLAYDDKEKNNYHYVVAEVDATCPRARDDIVKALHAENVLARKYFWPGCHSMRPYLDLFPNASAFLPQTQRVSQRVIVLPTGTSVGEQHIAVICDVIRYFCQK